MKNKTKNITSGYLREIVYGGNDGIVTTFAVVAGFNGANISSDALLGLSVATVLLFGLANLFADGVSMGLGNFLSIRSEKDVYARKKSEEKLLIKREPESESKETVSILLDEGFTKEDSETLATIYKKNPQYWLDWMMRYDLKIPNPENVNPYATGLVTFLSFLFFGSIPLLPYIFNTNIENSFLISIVSAFLALTLLGIIKAKVVGGNLMNSVLEIVFIGGIASLCAFAVGFIFNS